MMRFLGAAAWLLALVVAPASATAAAPPAVKAPAAVPAARTPARAKPKASPPPRAPAPQVQLSLEVPTTTGPWTMHVTNDGEVPVRLAADARLLALDVTPRGAAHPVRCELPADMRPADDLETPLVLPPKRSYTERFEPRLYCFGAAKLDALASGSIVVAHLGWVSGAASAPPYAVAAIDGVEPEVSSLKSLVSPPVALPDEVTPPLDPSTPGSAPATDTPHLVLAGERSVDASTADAIQVPLTLRNESSQTVVLRFRPETLGFDLIGPDSVQTCVWPTPPAASVREAFTRIAPHGETSLSVLLSAYCSGHAFDQGGLYVIRPRLDTRRASGNSVGYRSFDGVVVATSPTIVRLHKGTAIPSLRRPRVEPP
jgi:hypothetical protein